MPDPLETITKKEYYDYISKKKILDKYLSFRSLSDLILIDSGAHTFHTAQNIDFEKYTYEYADFIKKTDNPKVTGYFEMDIDNRIGYKKVLKLREILDETSDKIIPVWHKNRGFKNYKKMCRNYDYVSISCLPIEGIPNKDLIKFLNEEIIEQELNETLSYLFSFLKAIEIRNLEQKNDIEAKRKFNQILYSKRFSFKKPQNGFKIYKDFVDEIKEKAR